MNETREARYMSKNYLASALNQFALIKDWDGRESRDHGKKIERNKRPLIPSTFNSMSHLDRSLNSVNELQNLNLE